MAKMIHKVRSRKGFTMVEMIVVIAIIGVLTALILPALLYDGKPTTGKAMAKAFFYETQDLASSLKLSDHKSFEDECVAGPGVPGGGNAIVIYAQIKNDGSVEETGIIDRSDGSFTEMSAAMSGKDAEHARVYAKIKTALTKYTTRTDGMSGILFALIDSNGSVRAAYWTDSPKTESDSFTANIQLTDDHLYASGFYCAAYPEKLCAAGARIFVY